MNSRKTWNVINELASDNSGKSTKIFVIKVDSKIVSNPMYIAETINGHFTNVAQVLAQDINVVNVNTETYLEHTDHSFSLQIPSVDVVFNNLSKIDVKKATGLSMIPSILLKMAASIVAPSLTSIFTGRKNGFASNLLRANMTQICANGGINLSRGGKCTFAYLFTARQQFSKSILTAKVTPLFKRAFNGILTTIGQYL